MVIFELKEHNYYRDETITNLYKKKKDAENELATRKFSYLAKDIEMKVLDESDSHCALGWDDSEIGYDIYVVIRITERPVL